MAGLSSSSERLSRQRAFPVTRRPVLQGDNREKRNGYNQNDSHGLQILCPFPEVI